jgi:7-cyano-7-deazaguanine reductase
MNLEQSSLGKSSEYPCQYDNSLLFPIPRCTKRAELGLAEDYAFFGVDVWNAFEISWLNSKGKPVVRIGIFELAANSHNIIESKSFKLYLNSFNNTQFADDAQVAALMKKDLSIATNGEISVSLLSLTEYDAVLLSHFPGINIDNLDVEISQYQVNPEYLSADVNKPVEETLSSDLLKSNCLVTGQPDWGSVMIQYHGGQIDHSGLLKYLISFRNHDEFHEQCVERIYNDIMQRCKPEKLLVYARYTRRGGLDINPIRANYNYDKGIHRLRLPRQ